MSQPIKYPVSDGQKECNWCHIRKPVAQFSRDRSRPVGYRPSCKVCCKQRWPQDNDLRRDRYVAMELTAPAASPTHQCTLCQQIKPLAAFVKDKRCSTGYRRMCRLCNAKWRPPLEERRVYFAAYFADPVHREKRRVTALAWRAAKKAAAAAPTTDPR